MENRLLGTKRGPTCRPQSLGENKQNKERKVHTLADRFLLPRLAKLCEVFVSDVALRPTIVVPLLAQSISIHRSEAFQMACWEFLQQGKNWKDVVSRQEGVLRELVEQRHPLALELLLSSTGITLGKWCASLLT